MSGNVKQFVDFTGNTNNDTGENNATSIQPVANGEVVDAAVTARPGESLRQRTEAIRDVMADSLYLRDADRNFVAFCLGGVTWPGSTSNAQSGIPVLTNALYLIPMLTPGAVQVSAPPVTSMFGVLHLKRSSDNANAISVTSGRRSYAAGDQINVTVSSGASFSCVLDVETGLRRTIKIIATGATTLGTVISALNGIVPPAPDNTQLVTAALEGGASSGDLLLVPQARQLVVGNYDGEAHQISVAAMSSFFASNPTQALAEGDSLCVRYDMVTDGASTGGRRQSLVENSNTAIPAGSLFNSRVHPEFLVNALPVCKVLNNRLVFGTGVEVPEGGVNFKLSPGIYDGGPAWADGTLNPATSVEAQLDKIITDLATAAGTAKIQGAAIGSDVIAGTLATQLSNITTLISNARNLSATRLLDQMISTMVPGDLGTAADPELLIQAAGSNNTGTEWCYALTLSAGMPLQGSTNKRIKICAGTVFQRVTGGSPQATFIPHTFPGTDEVLISDGNGVNPRVDLVQMSLGWSGVPQSGAVSITLNVKAGTPAATPAYPAPDAGFVPICYVYVGATYAGANQFGQTTITNTAFAAIHDVRMPLRVKAYMVNPTDFMYGPTAWADNATLDTNVGSSSVVNTASPGGTEGDRLIIPCPAIRGRLVGVALCSRNSNSSAVVLVKQRNSGLSSDGTFAVISSLLEPAGTSLVFHRGGQELIELASTDPLPQAPGGSVPRKAYGPPIWCPGSRWMGSLTGGVLYGVTTGTMSMDRLVVRITPTFNNAAKLEVAGATFYVAEGV